MVQRVLSKSVLEEPVDCLWVILDTKRTDHSFSTTLLRELDWKMRGFLGRVLKDGRGTHKTVFIPVEGWLPIKMCAVDSLNTFIPEHFEKNLNGLRAEKIVVVFENERVKSEVDNEILKKKTPHLFKKCQCIEDHC